MPGVIIILLVTISVGLVTFIYDLKWRNKHPEVKEGEIIKDESAGESHGEICCGRHLVCEKSLSPLPGDKIEYFDDEELDRFAGRQGDSYDEMETEEIREIMMSVRPEELASWARSLQLRNIELPYSLRDMFFMLLKDE